MAIISAGTNEGVKLRLESLGIKDVYLGAYDKIKQFETYIKNNNINPENIHYMGDDVPDYPVMKLVGLPTCPQDACAEVKAISKYVSHQKGGEGAPVIEPGLAEKLRESVQKAAQKQEANGGPVILLVATQLRFQLSRFVRAFVPDIAVLAYNEIPQTKQITIVASVGT